MQSITFVTGLVCSSYKNTPSHQYSTAYLQTMLSCLKVVIPLNILEVPIIEQFSGQLDFSSILLQV